MSLPVGYRPEMCPPESGQIDERFDARMLAIDDRRVEQPPRLARFRAQCNSSWNVALAIASVARRAYA
jgi:hypothetical protein